MLSWVIIFPLVKCPWHPLRALLVVSLLGAGSAAVRAQPIYPPLQEYPLPPELPAVPPAPPAAKEAEPAVPETAEPEVAQPEADNLQGTVGEVRIITKSIFDPDKPGEDKWVFRMADRLHRTTRPRVIERQILLEPGDPYSPEAVAESERLLRANRYLYDARIRPVPAADGRIDLEVETRDVWTLRAGIGFNRAGGENSADFTLQDSNFLGTGKDLTLWRISNVDRTSTLFRYRDPNTFGTRTQLEISAADYSDGGSRRFEIERPFYSLDTKRAAAFKVYTYERTDSLYDQGEIFQKIAHQREQLEAYLGFSEGRSGRITRRWLVGFNRELDEFEYPPGGDSTPLPPTNRLFTYPWIGFEYVEDGFIAERQLDQIQRTEDVNLGAQFLARVGWSTSAFGAERDHLIANLGMRTGWRPGARQMLLASLEGGSRWGSQGRENFVVGGNLRYYLRNFGKGVFYTGIEGVVSDQLDPETQILLGGDNGLRGYPIRFQTGDRRWLLQVEQRFFSNRELFHVMHVGGAVFFDAGRAWFKDDEFFDQPTLTDVGIGLRLGSSRSSSGAMVHLDLAYPLDRQEGIDSVQWLVSTSDTF